jgi:hypothetical protein
MKLYTCDTNFFSFFFFLVADMAVEILSASTRKTLIEASIFFHILK